MLAMHRACHLGLLGAAALCLLLAPGSGLAAKPKTENAKTMLSFPTSALRAQEIASGAFSFPIEKIWTDFWEQHSNGTAPSVDFSHWQIVAVFLGQQPNAGYGVEITGYDVKGSAVTVSYTRLTPRPGMMYAQMITYPYDIVAIPARGEVSFCESTRVQPPRPAAAPAKIRTLAVPKLKAKAPLQYNVFTSAQAWRQFWNKYETGKVPAVDFAKNAVLAIVYPPGYVTPGIGPAVRAGSRLTLTLTRRTSAKEPPLNVQQPTLVVIPRAPRIDLAAAPRPAPPQSESAPGPTTTPPRPPQ